MQVPAADHFTADDRRNLTETLVHLEYLKKGFDRLTETFREMVDSESHKSKAAEEKQDKRHEGLDLRVRALENFRWWILGAIAAAGTAGGFIGHSLK